MEQRQHLGRAMANVFMGITSRLTDGLPMAAGLRNSLVWAGFVHTPHGQPHPLALGVGLLDQAFFALASGSWTTTSPRLRLRIAAPVWHQDRSRCQLIPASCRTAQIVYVLTFGKPSGARRRARCSVFNDQVAVPSCSRSGGRRNSLRIRSRSAGPYSTGGAPPPCLGTIAPSPTWLKRATHCAIESPTARPTSCAASVYELPALTASIARARATDAAGALWLRANRSRALRSELVNGRSGSFLIELTPALLGQLLETAPEVYRIIDHLGKLRCQVTH
jgi:hypothetical protein